jgi:uncharacterized membrane protein YccC
MTNATSKYKAELRLVIRALTAAALSLVTANALALPQSYWAVFTALIIVQGSVGGTLAAGLDRFVGTLAGAVLGAAVALAGEFWRVPQVLLLLLAVAPVALLAAIRPSFRIAPVTAAILLLTTPSNAYCYSRPSPEMPGRRTACSSSSASRRSCRRGAALSSRSRA